MKWGIIGALDAEIASIHEAMEPEDTIELYGSHYYLGKLEEHDIVAVCGGVGTINAAICTNAVIREFGAQVIINLGIAGSSSTDLRILDVVIGDDVMFHDADLDILAKYYPFRRSFATDARLRMLAVNAIESLPGRDFEWKIGRVASGDAYITSRQRKNSIIARCHPACIEMEGAAVAQVSFMNNTPFLVVRTLSDNADENTDENYNNFLERAANNSARIVMQMLRMDNMST